MTGTPPWMTPDELAERSGIPVETIRHHCRAGHIEGATRAGRSWIIPTVTGRLWADNYTRYYTLRQQAAGSPDHPSPDPAA